MRSSYTIIIILLLSLLLITCPVEALLKNTTTGIYTTEVYTNVTGVSGNDTWTAPYTDTLVEYVAIGGGGAGGYQVGGGGGAGAFRNGTLFVSGSVPIMVGSGGPDSGTTQTVGAKGGWSKFASIDAEGGGGGAGTTSESPGSTGGSGGGAHGSQTGSSANNASYGNKGGNGISSINCGAGGGGKGSAGIDIIPAEIGTDGGDGISNSITGTPVIYAAGGGGAGAATGGAGGSSGVGGHGNQHASIAASAGTPNTGSGGGGNYVNSPAGTSAGGSGIVIIKYITSPSFPTVYFSTNVTSGENPLSLSLNDTSTESPTMWNTSWGDNAWTNQTAFPATNITHSYSTSGVYWINHYATNTYGIANGTPLLIIVYGTANSDFSSFNIAGTAKFTTYFYDTSTNRTPGPETFFWDFGDGNTSTSQNQYYTYNSTGNFTVKHSFSNGLSTSWKNETDYITVGTPTPPVVAPVASFYGGPQIGAPPLQVFFTDVSTNTPTSWNWSMGDGLFDENQNPTHWYNTSGFFTVSLTATNSAGSNTTTQSNFVMVY